MRLGYSHTFNKISLIPAARLQLEYPMLFRLENRSSGQATHTGVLEFIADEGMAYVPYWVGHFFECNFHKLE